jgi:hypothetical protein
VLPFETLLIQHKLIHCVPTNIVLLDMNHYTCLTKWYHKASQHDPNDYAETMFDFYEGCSKRWSIVGPKRNIRQNHVNRPVEMVWGSCFFVPFGTIFLNNTHITWLVLQFLSFLTVFDWPQKQANRVDSTVDNNDQARNQHVARTVFYFWFMHNALLCIHAQMDLHARILLFPLFLLSVDRSFSLCTF